MGLMLTAREIVAYLSNWLKVLCSLCFYLKSSLNHHILVSKRLVPSYKSTHSNLGLGKVTGAAGSWPFRPMALSYHPLRTFTSLCVRD